MTQETLKKLYKHFCFLAKGDFSENDFAVNYGDGGSMSIGDMSAQRIDLMKSDAQRHKESMEIKHPELKEVEKQEPKPKKKESKE